MTESPQLPGKKDVSRSFLLRGSVFLHLDPRKDGVVVPEWLRKQPQLVLQIGLDMPIPIPDLRVDDAGVTGSLSFNRAPCLCVVPWDAVFAVVGEDGRGMVWPESMPSEIAAEVEREGRRNRLRDASKTEPLRPPNIARADSLRERLTDPAPTARPPVSAPAPIPKRQPNAQTVPPRKPSRAAVEPQGPSRRPLVKDTTQATKRGAKRPLPPYLRVVK